jgi:DNA replication protein DnaC
VGYLRREVPPTDPDFGHPIPCQCKLAERQEQHQRDLWQGSNLGLLTRMTFDTFLPAGHGLNPELQDNLRKAFDRARKYAEEPTGWLVLKGGYGSGKTHLAAAIANHLVERGKSVLFVVVPDLLDHLRTTYAPNSPVSFDQRFEMVRSAPVLILDDLGAHNTTSWAQEKLYQILNYRYNAQLPTVITTNSDIEDLDPRLQSRIAELEWSAMVHILAPDYRAGANAQQSELSSLGLHSEQTFESFDLQPETRELDPAQRANLRRALATAKAYAENPAGWLVFTGDYGSGKTHLAAGIANHRMFQNYAVVFVVVPDLLDHLRATFSPQSSVGFDRRFEEIRTTPLLVLDDLGTQSATPWAQEKLFQVFDYRYNARLPTVITMTRDVDLDPRLKTRILDTRLCQVFEITAPSYRGRTDVSDRSSRTRGTGLRRSTPAAGHRGRGVGVSGR